MSLIHSFKVAGAVCGVGLIIAFYQRGQEINRLKVQTQQQTEQLEQQQQAYQTLQHHLAIEKQATLTQKVINDEIQQKRENLQREVRTLTQSQPCAHTAIDRRALERLRQ
ncbi:MAG: DUF2570 family protein [Haemophilus parahaemolyticus]|uniref:DUF2570 family protein n=1 Tax=Haemophilus parahaemolyticus TaxID=735 RepID=UPI0026F10C20|nr:DUF2570 family protein [Haemophilus parahaemolyticus]MBS6009595.1 DUF2570 family protein [Haemophilus parahaemolyticus]